jgi:hypothetical protein
MLLLDCGGDQLVIEACFPVDCDKSNDIEFALRVLKEIEDDGLITPNPIEQVIN